MFIGYLVIPDAKQKTGAIDISSVTVSSDDEIEVVAKIISLRDDRHIGFQIFNTTLWSFTDVVFFEDFIIE